MNLQREESLSSVSNQTSELPSEIRLYVDQTKLEQTLTNLFNDVLVRLPVDPFSEFCSILKSQSKDSYIIKSISIKEKLFEDFKSFSTFEVSMIYKGTERKILTYPIPFSSPAYEKISASPEELTKTYNEIFSEQIKNFEYIDPDEFDNKIMELIKGKNKEKDEITLSLSNTLSLISYISTAYIKNMELSDFIRKNKSNIIFKNTQIKEKSPCISFCVFKTGKNANSKIKYERFFIMINGEAYNKSNNSEKKKILIELYPKMFEIIKKALTSGKGGENGMKPNNEGSFTPPSDKYEDVLKLMEGFIKDINTAMNNQNMVTLGIDFNADNFYNSADTSYEPEGVKKPVDNIQLIDLYIKLISDHPSLTYLEQPISNEDEEGWDLILEKFKEKQNICIVRKGDMYKKEPEPKAPVANPNPEVEKKEVKVEVEKKEVKETKKKSKKKRKTVETVKTEEQVAKKEETVKKEKPKVNFFSYKLTDANVLSHFFTHIKKIKEKNPNIGAILYTNDYETPQAGIIQLGMALNLDYIILNGVDMSEQKIIKIKEYLEELENFDKCEIVIKEENKNKVEEKKENVKQEVKNDVGGEILANNENKNINIEDNNPDKKNANQ